MGVQPMPNADAEAANDRPADDDGKASDDYTNERLDALLSTVNEVLGTEWYRGEWSNGDRDLHRLTEDLPEGGIHHTGPWMYREEFRHYLLGLLEGVRSGKPRVRKLNAVRKSDLELGDVVLMETGRAYVVTRLEPFDAPDAPQIPPNGFGWMSLGGESENWRPGYVQGVASCTVACQVLGRVELAETPEDRR